MKMFIYTSILVSISIVCYFLLKKENEQIKMEIIKFDPYDESIKFYISIKNNTHKDIDIKDLYFPFEKNFKITNLSDTNSVITPLPVSMVRPYTLKLTTNQKILFEVYFLSIMKKGTNIIEVKLIDKKGNEIAKSNKKIYLNKAIESKNFSKSAQFEK